MMTLLFKKRLRLLIQFTTGSHLQFSKQMEKLHDPVTSTAISAWCSEDSTALPTVEHLITIQQIEPDISLDFMVGNKAGITELEKLIEKRTK